MVNIMKTTNKIVITLFGKSHTGKTTTLNKVIDKLNVDYEVNNVREKPFSLIDRLVTININGVMVGISTGGDHVGIIKRRLDDLLEKNCSIIVTATRTKGKPKKAVDEFIKQNNYKIDWIEKSATVSKEIDKEEYEKRNKRYNITDSEVILQAIFHYLKNI